MAFENLRQGIEIIVKDIPSQEDLKMTISSENCGQLKSRLHAEHELPPPRYQEITFSGQVVPDAALMADLGMEQDAICHVAYPNSTPVRVCLADGSGRTLPVSEVYEGETEIDLLNRAIVSSSADADDRFQLFKLGSENVWIAAAADGRNAKLEVQPDEELRVGCCNPNPDMWTTPGFHISEAVVIRPTPAERLVSFYNCGGTACPCALCHTPEIFSADTIPDELALIGLTDDKWGHHINKLLCHRRMAWATPCQWIWWLYVAVNLVGCVGWLLPVRYCLDIDNHCLRC